MKTVKISDLSGPALDWAVAKCEGDSVGYRRGYCYTWDEEGRVPYSPSSDWSLAGPIIEREEIHPFTQYPRVGRVVWYARHKGQVTSSGSTPLIAAMRCYVASRLGDTVEIPEELI